ncbi:MAG: hypothetical protein LBI79_11035 [Nitrososphaerota archaeon]|jgi:hypothetical protein|nr:hypothetical protein [Nitrososphaerota archaeon]
MMAELLLTPEELAVRILKAQHMSNKYISAVTSFSPERIRTISESIDKKNRIAARHQEFYSLSSKYSRILRMTETYYGEVDNDVAHVFNLDFSDIHIYLNPIQTSSQDQSNIGCIHYMFDLKQPNHRYCMLPPVAWELLHHTYMTYVKVKQNSNFDLFIKNKKIKKFYNSIKDADKKNPSISGNDLLHHYKGAGGLLGILSLAQQDMLDEKLMQELSDLRIMTTEKKIILPMEETKRNAKQVKINDNIYKKAFSNLTYCRPHNSLNNHVDASSLAITYSLNEGNITKGNKQDAFYRLISSSKLPLEAFRPIKFDGTHISCCPQFVSTLIFFEEKLAKKINATTLSQRRDYLGTHIKRLENIKRQCVDLQYPQRFISAKYVENETVLMEKALEPIRSYLSDIIEFRCETYPTLIRPILEINSGYPEYHKENIESLKNLFEQPQKHKETVEEASEMIYDNLEKTYRLLYDYVNENHNELLTPKMKDLMANIDNQSARDVKIT